MKSLVYAVVAASVLAAPIASFAQSNDPVTRAQVRAELVQLEKAGYNPGSGHTDYPANIQAAEQRIHQQNGTAADASGYGGEANGATQSSAGRPMNVDGVHPLYFGR
jgi:Ni/Co efflux regulator RcnB